MARGSYFVTGSNITVANAAQTILSLRPNTTASIEFLRLWISQAANATSAQQRVDYTSKAAVLGSGYTSGTVNKAVQIDATSTLSGGTTEAAGAVGIGNATVTEGAGTETIIGSDSFNVLNGWLWVPTPAETIIFGAAAATPFQMRFAAAPGTLTGWNWGCTFREQ